MGVDRVSWRIYITRGVAIGIVLTAITTALVVYFVFFAARLHITLMIISIISFQLCFIWTCAEILDGPDEEIAEEDKSRNGHYLP
jgi:hypothetical protein